MDVQLYGGHEITTSHSLNHTVDARIHLSEKKNDAQPLAPVMLQSNAPAIVLVMVFIKWTITQTAKQFYVAIPNNTNITELLTLLR